MGEQKFFVCKHCGNVVGMAVSGGGPLTCCGQKMAELVPNTEDASHEKHVPAVTKTAGGISVNVGSAAHPMEEKHYIMFVYVATKNGGQKKTLKAGASPVAEFSFAGGDEPTAVYAYCNLHGLWKCAV
jgi:superoxide reductase